MNTWVGNVKQVTLGNENFRSVLFTGKHSQLTVMSIPSDSDIGWEAHDHLDQFIRLEQGQARLDLGSTEGTVEESHDVEDDWAVTVPAGVWHNLVNTGSEYLKLYSIYSPAEHPEGTVHATKAEAEAHEHAT